MGDWHEYKCFDQYQYINVTIIKFVILLKGILKIIDKPL